MKVKDVMTRDPVYAVLPGNRRDVLKLLTKNNKTGVPVVTKEGKVTGFVTRQAICAKPEVEQLALIMYKDYPTVAPAIDIKAAAKLFRERGIHHMAVVDKGKLVGIVTPTDLLSVIEDMGLREPIERYVKSPCVPIYKDAPLAVAATAFAVSGVNALPVLDDDGTLCGLVTDRDVFRMPIEEGKVSKLGLDKKAKEWAGLRNISMLYYEISNIELPKLPVSKVMAKNPVTAFAKTTVSDVARMMRKNDYGQIPIRDSKDHLVAMVYELDVLAALEGK
jgi:CBS domain-containing protein